MNNWRKQKQHQQLKMQQRLKYNSSSIQAAAKKNEKIQKTNSRNPKGLRRPRSGVQIQYANTKKIFSKIQRALSSLLWRVNTICKILKNLFSKIQRALSSSLWLTKYKIQNIIPESQRALSSSLWRAASSPSPGLPLPSSTPSAWHSLPPVNLFDEYKINIEIQKNTCKTNPLFTILTSSML